MTQNISFKTTFSAKEITEELIKGRATKFEQLLQGAGREIVKRTQSGQDFQGSAFEAYTPEYQNWKNGLTPSGNARRRKKGRLLPKGKAGKPGRGDTVNLTLSGDMLGGVDSQVTREGFTMVGRIQFKTPDQSRKAVWNSKKRDFFKLSNAQIESIKNKLK